MIEIIPNWHPIIVHFSVALLVTATVILTWATIKGRFDASDRLVSSGRLMLWLGLIAIAVTVAAGLQAFYSVNHDSPSHSAMILHKNWAFVTLTAFIVVGYIMWRKRADSLSVLAIVALVLSTGLLLSTAYKGSELVYKYGLGVQSLPTVSGDGHDHEHKHEAKSGTQSDDASARIDPALVADALYQALNVGDGEAVGKLLAKDVMILESGHAQTSRAEYMEGHMKSDMAFLPFVTNEILDRSVEQSGDTAWVITHSRMIGTYQDEAIDSISREMLVMKYNGHDWQITLVHWSEK